MALRDLLSPLGTALLVLVVVAMIVGHLAGQPVLLGYVTSQSMAPALSPGDGFVAVPSALAGEARPGDVVVFEAETIQGGGLTTHRVVEVTDRGYVTKGDANPFTDQDGGEPHVTEEQIVAHALQVDGWVVPIPFLGTAVATLQGLLAAPFALLGTERVGTVLVFLGMFLFVLAGALGGADRRTERSRTREDVMAVWVVVLVAAGIVALAATAAMVVPAGDYQIEVLVTQGPSDNSQIVAPNGTAAVTYGIHNAGIVPALVVSEPLDQGMTIEPSRTVLGFDERRTVSVEMAAPREPGEYTRTVRESRYLLVLPPSVLRALHAVHPLVAILAVDVVAALFVVTLSVAVFGTGYLRVRPSPDVPVRIRLARRLRRFR